MGHGGGGSLDEINGIGESKGRVSHGGLQRGTEEEGGFGFGERRVGFEEIGLAGALEIV
jgi:hypothetical protein